MWGSQMALVVKNPPANTGEVRDAGSVPGLGRSPGEGHGNPLQYSCLENPMASGAWWATVHRVAKSQTRLSNLACMQKECINVCMSLYMYTYAYIFKGNIYCIRIFFNLYIYAICTFPDLMKTGVLLKIKWSEKEEAGQLRNN